MIKALTEAYRVCISLLNLTTEKLILILLMHKNNIFSPISPLFIGAGAPCPHPHRSMKAYRVERRDYDDLVSLSCLCLYFSFPFLSFPFPFSPLFNFFWQRGPRPPWICAWPMLYESHVCIYNEHMLIAQDCIKFCSRIA